MIAMCAAVVFDDNPCSCDAFIVIDGRRRSLHERVSTSCSVSYETRQVGPCDPSAFGSVNIAPGAGGSIYIDI